MSHISTLTSMVGVKPLLAAKGYQLHNGLDDDTPQLGMKAWWFTWAVDGMDGVETVGETVESEDAAVQSALEHFFENAKIENERREPSAYYPLGQREHATVLAALRCFQEVDSECSGDLPDRLLDIATNGDTVERLDTEEIDGLCERLNQ